MGATRGRQGRQEGSQSVSRVGAPGLPAGVPRAELRRRVCYGDPMDIGRGGKPAGWVRLRFELDACVRP